MRCRDGTEFGFARYVALAVLGRNLQALGKLLMAREDKLASAAQSKRAAALGLSSRFALLGTDVGVKKAARSNGI